jgi:hypothetical protein
MSILYTLVAKDMDVIICDYSEYEGNFEQISINLLKKTETESRATFVYGSEYFFHYLNISGLTYMVMCDSRISKETAFTYLGH